MHQVCPRHSPPHMLLYTKANGTSHVERPETPPTPLSTILPFDRDPDYVERGSLLEDIGAKLSRAAARVALVGLGGVGYARSDVTSRRRGQADRA
jgi:hypothetical protein